MTVNLANSATLYDDATLRGRVRAAMIAQSVAVATEPGDTANHDVRWALAKAILRDPAAYVPAFTGLVANDDATSQKSVAADVSDGAIAQIVPAVWTRIAQALVL